MAKMWEVQTADFRRTAYRLVRHAGRLWMMATCQERVAGRWEGFVALVPVKEA